MELRTICCGAQGLGDGCPMALCPLPVTVQLSEGCPGHLCPVVGAALL